MFGTTLWGVEPFGSAPAYATPAAPTFENALFLSSRAFDGATIAGSSEVSTLPASYLQSVDPMKRWRTVSKVDQYLNITLAQPLACDTLAAIGEFSQCAVWRLLARTASLPTSSTHDLNTGWRSVWPGGVKPIDEDQPLFVTWLRFANTQPFLYWRLELADIVATRDYLELGRIWLGQAFQPAFNVDADPALALLAPDHQSRTPFGRLVLDRRGDAPRRQVLNLSEVNATDLKAGLHALQRYCGLARDFAFSLDPAATTDQHLLSQQAVFENQAQFQLQPAYDAAGALWRTQLSIVEP
jgi:hypothetical protein